MISIKNPSLVEDVILVGVRIAPGTSKDLSQLELILWANDALVLTSVVSGTVEVYLNGVLVGDISIAIDVLKSDTPRKTYTLNTPFADKKLMDGKKVYTRIHGAVLEVQGAADTLDFTIPYANCKITGIEIIGGGIGDTIDLQIMDTDTGTISGFPNYMLNQFGFSVNICDGYYEYKSSYDADLIGGLKLRVIYDAKDELLPKTIRFNFFLHQVV